MSPPAEVLADALAASGARRIAFLGLAKNVGKTTALVAALAELARRGIVTGTTSAGRDGESFDALTGHSKPPFRVWPEQLVASAASCFAASDLAADSVASLPFRTRFGGVEVRRVRRAGDVEVVGPSLSSELARTCEALEEAGAAIVLIDGAFGRRAFASSRLSDGIVLSIGLAAGRDAADVLDRALRTLELIRLGAPEPGASARAVPGALTDSGLAADPPAPGETLVAEDFASIFLSPERRRRLAREGIGLAVRRPARLLAVTVNPTSPGLPPAPARAFFDAAASRIRDVTILDLHAGWSAHP